MAQSLLAPPVSAQSAGDSNRLLEIIENQQQRLDAQERQLQEQQEVLRALREEVEAMKAQASAGNTIASPAHGVAEPAKADDAPEPEADWAGSVAVPGSDTRFKISGFARLDALHDSDAIETPSAFVTSAIVTRNATPGQGSEGETNFSVQASQLALETRTPIRRDRQLRTFLSVDFFDDFFSNANELRLREAYGEVDDVLFGGDLLIGQAWTTYTYLQGAPSVLDFQGLNAQFGTRHPLVRWTRELEQGFTLRLAAEAPDLRNFENTTSTSRWPDGVAALSWEGDAANLQAAVLARDLRADDQNGSTVSDFGWGTTVMGRVNMPGDTKDFATFSLTYGEGIGGVLNDATRDASLDPVSGDFEAIPTLAWFAGYQHFWTPTLYSVATYSRVRLDNLDYQAPEEYKQAEYASLNLTWTPDPQWLFGFETLYGSREDRDGSKGSVVRTMFSSSYLF